MFAEFLCISQNHYTRQYPNGEIMMRMKLVQFYPYRTAYVRGNAIHFPREWMKNLEDNLSQMARQKYEGTDYRNHTCYVVQFEGYPDETIRAFMFTDSMMIMGDRVDVGKW